MGLTSPKWDWRVPPRWDVATAPARDPERVENPFNERFSEAALAAAKWDDRFSSRVGLAVSPKWDATTAPAGNPERGAAKWDDRISPKPGLAVSPKWDATTAPASDLDPDQNLFNEGF
jgi:hypothetical protein